jgi:hypothetical protein
MRVKELELTIHGIAVDVKFSYNQWDAYYPQDGYEVEINAIKVKGVDISDIVSERIIDHFKEYIDHNFKTLVLGE